MSQPRATKIARRKRVIARLLPPETRPLLKAYCDTSFLVSLHAPDANSARAAAESRRTRAALLLSPL